MFSRSGSILKQYAELLKLGGILFLPMRYTILCSMFAGRRHQTLWIRYQAIHQLLCATPLYSDCIFNIFL